MISVFVYIASCISLYLVISAHRQESLSSSAPLQTPCVCLPQMCKYTRKSVGGGIPSHLSLSSSFFRSFISRWTTFKTCSASSSVRPDRSSFRPIFPGCWSKGGGQGEALLLWGPRLGQPWGKTEGWRNYKMCALVESIHSDINMPDTCQSDWEDTWYPVIHDFHQPLLAKKLEHQ